MLAIDLPHARRLAYGVVLGQAVVTAAGACGAWLLVDSRAGLSALLGGGIAALGSLVMAALAFGGARRDATRIVGAFYVGEAAKVALVIVLFVAVLKWVNVTPLAMLAAFAANFLVYWIALISALPGLSGSGRRA